MKTLILTILLTLLFIPIPGLAWQDRDHIKYNPMADQWKYTAPRDRIKYNPMEDTWSYESQDSHLRYNPMEDRFEYTE